MTVGVAGFALRRRAEYGGDVVVTFDIGLLREIKVSAIGLRFPGECRLQVSFRLAAFQVHGVPPGLNGLSAGGLDRF
jgi:hypothetical protein